MMNKKTTTVNWTIDKKRLHIHQFACIKQRNSLWGLFQTYRLSFLYSALSSLISYCTDVFCWCICCYRIELMCSISFSFFWLSFPCALLGSKQHFSTVRAATYCKCVYDLCRIYNGSSHQLYVFSNQIQQPWNENMKR